MTCVKSHASVWQRAILCNHVDLTDIMCFENFSSSTWLFVQHFIEFLPSGIVYVIQAVNMTTTSPFSFCFAGWRWVTDRFAGPSKRKFLRIVDAEFLSCCVALPTVSEYWNEGTQSSDASIANYLLHLIFSDLCLCFYALADWQIIKINICFSCLFCRIKLDVAWLRYNIH